MPDPMGDAMYRASADVLTAAAQVGAGWSAPTAAALRGHILGLLKDFVTRCRDAGIADVETAEARYALVAFVDDRVLKETAWPGRAEWMNNPLQLQFFREYTAGENFFARMRALVHRGPPAQALEVYYLCLALGFVGALPASGAGAQRGYAESARNLLLLGGVAGRIAPNAVPQERVPSVRPPFPLARTAALACVALCVLALVGLQFSLRSLVDRAGRDLAEAKAAPTAGGR